MFELTTPTTAMLTSVTNRAENHGDQKVPAISLGLKITAANGILDKLSKTLRQQLYEAEPGQADLPGVDEATPIRRSRMVECVSLKGAGEGWTLVVAHGIDDSSAITFASCKVDAFKVFPRDDGIVDLTLRVGTSAINEATLGAIGVKNGQEISLTLTAPKVKPEAIDASSSKTDLPPDAGSLFAAAHGPEDGAEGDGESEGGEPDHRLGEAKALVISERRASISMVQRHLQIGYNRAARMLESLEAAGIVSAMGPDGARTVLLTEEPEFSPASTRTARGRAKTKAALAAGAH